MENIKTMLIALSLFKPALPLIGIVMLIRFIGICVTDGFRSAIILFARLAIALLAIFAILCVILLFV